VGRKDASGSGTHKIRNGTNRKREDGSSKGSLLGRGAVGEEFLSNVIEGLSP